MSWFKNLWSRVFDSDDDEARLEDARKQPQPKTARSAPFRFPLIPDEDKQAFLAGEPDEQEIQDVRPTARIEPSMKRTELRAADRDRFRDQDIITPVTPVRNPRPIREVSRTAPLPKRTELKDKPGSSRRFEPTRVPSPVYGFQEQRPLPIEQLLDQKETATGPETTTEILKSDQHEKVGKDRTGMETFISDVALTPSAAQQAERVRMELKGLRYVQPEEKVVAPPVQEKITMPEEIAQPEVVAEPVAEPVTPVITAEPQSTEEPIEIAEPIEEKPAVAEAYVSHAPPAPTKIEVPEQLEEPITEEPEETPQTVEVVEEPVLVPAPVAEKVAEPEVKKPSTERKVPFNVLMLKSDKQKMQQRPVGKPVLPKAVQEVKAPELVVQQPEVVAIEETSAPEVEVPQTEIVKTAEPVAAYFLPEKDSLRPPENDLIDTEWMEEQGDRLVEALSHFHINAEITSIVQGPAVTQFELTVAHGVKVSKIRNLADDLKLALAARDIRIQAPIPGKSSIGIEIPNRKSRPVRISEIIGSDVFTSSDSPLEAALGLDLTGKPVSVDLRKMPHGLIAGATGSGKSVCINSILVSLLFKSTPRDLKLLLIDPKMVELAPYNHIPHLLSPVITDVKAATASLKWAVEEMERRYQLFAHTGVRDIARYNKMVASKGQPAQHLPHILIIIDELADLMMAAPSDVEESICRIAQKARACGIHLVIATQRPSVDVITGLIKSNIPTRIAFSVSSQVDSRTILDSQGAERLLGKGDMLYLGNGMSAPVRIQGTFVTDEEIEDVIAHVRKQGEPEYIFKEEELIRSSYMAEEQDELFEEACRLIVTQSTASTSMLQRHFRIGYNRAARLMDMIEEQGVISVQNGSKPRTVLMTKEDMEEVFQ